MTRTEAVTGRRQWAYDGDSHRCIVPTGAEGCQPLWAVRLLVVVTTVSDAPAHGAASTHDAAQEHRTAAAGDAVVVASHVAGDPIPHISHLAEEAISYHAQRQARCHLLRENETAEAGANHDVAVK